MNLDPLPILSALDEAGVDYVLGGDAAALIHGAPYGALALEITPAPDGPNLERVARALERLDATTHGETASARIVATSWGVLEVVFEPSGTQGYADLRRASGRTTVSGIDIRIASLADVIRLKEATGRERDRGLLHLLRRILEQ